MTSPIFIRSVQDAPTPIGAYSPAVICGELAFISGQIGLDPKSNLLVEGGIEAQMKQVISNLTAILIATGSSIEKILMTTVFLSNMADLKVVNELYGSFVNSQNPPARQTVAVKELPAGAMVEISIIAYVRGR